MKVWVVQQYSYGPEDVLGVYSSEEKAIKALKNAGFNFETAEENNYKDTWKHGDNKDGWLGADIMEMTLDN